MTSVKTAVIDARSIHRLQAMDVEVWRLRGRRQSSVESAGSAEPQAGPGAQRPAGRIRLEAGSGRWLLVVDDAERARHAALLEDLGATLGTGDCRFGTWSDSPESGIAISDLDAHGIRHALVFGAGDDLQQQLLHVGAVDRLASSGEARRALWQRIKPLLEA